MKSNRSNPATESGVNAQEQRIRSLLAQSRWRKARDEVKPLCKADRARYLPLLIEANVGLAREMLARRQVSEARQVVAYLKTIAPREAWQALETEIAVRSGDYSAAIAACLHSLDQGGRTLPEAQKRRVADQLVVAFQPIETGAAGTAAIAAELAAIHEALAAISAEQYDHATELIRPLPHDSAFRNWKLYIKGLAAFHRGDEEKAARILTEVPPDTTPGRASLPYLYWLGKTNGGACLADMPEHAWEVLARLAGAPEAARLLVRAERLWHEGRPREMYSLLRDGIEALPSESPDWIGMLSEFCLHCLTVLPMKARAEYGMFLDDLERRGRIKSARERKMLLRVLCLDGESDPDAVYLQTQWDRFIHLRERLDGVNPRLSSLAYEWLGRVLSTTRPGDPFALPFSPHQRSKMPDAQGAVRALQKSVELDPENLGAQIMLATVYDQLKRIRERNRLLDEMTRRFPDNKQVLFMAGNRCIDRKAYAKGLTYLQRALQHDRLDPAIPEAIAVARTQYALEHFRRGRLAEARQTLDAVRDLIIDRPDDFVRGRWSTALRRGVLESMYGEEAQAREFLAEARAGSPSPEAFLVFGHILWKRYERQWTNQDPFSGELAVVLRSQASAARAAMLVHILDFWRGRSGAPPLNVAEILVRDYLRSAARRPFSRDEARELIERIHPGSPLAFEAKPFIKAILKKDGKDPLFRVYDYRCNRSPFDPPGPRRKALNSIMDEAVRRKDDAAIQAARKDLDELDLPSPLPPFEPFYEDEDDEDDEDFDPDFDGVADSMSEFVGSLDPDEFAELQEMLRNAPEREIRQLKKSRPKGIPEELFDMFLEAVRQGKIGSTAVPEIEPKPRRSQRKNPNQGDLF